MNEVDDASASHHDEHGETVQRESRRPKDTIEPDNEPERREGADPVATTFIADSDDEERMQELAEEEETSYWSALTGNDTSRSLLLHRRPDDTEDPAVEQSVVRYLPVEDAILASSPSSPPPLSPTRTPSKDDSSRLAQLPADHLAVPHSPDPLDLLANGHSPAKGVAYHRIDDSRKQKQDVSSPLQQQQSQEAPSRQKQEMSSIASPRSTTVPVGRTDVGKAVFQGAPEAKEGVSRIGLEPLSSDEDLPTLSQTFIRHSPVRQVPPPSSSLSSTSPLATSSEDEGPTVVAKSARTTDSSSASRRSIQGQQVRPPEPRNSPPLSSLLSTVDTSEDKDNPSSVASPAHHKVTSPQEARQQLQEDAPFVEIGGRQLRKRTAIQLEPYTREFATFATKAARNDWQGIIITAGLNKDKETPEQLAARLEKQKHRKVDTLGGWLEVDENEGIPVTRESQGGPLPSHHQRAHNGDEGSTDDGFIPSSSPPLYVSSSRSAKRRGSAASSSSQDGSSIDIERARPIKHRTSVSYKTKRAKPPVQQGSRVATTSKVTIDDALAAVEARRKRKTARQSVKRPNVQLSTRPARAGSEPASSPGTTTPRRPPRSVSSSPPAIIRRLEGASGSRTSASRAARGRGPAIPHHSNGKNTTLDLRALSDSDVELVQAEPDASLQSFGQSSSSQPNGDSPERPELREDRFTLNATKKKALRGMMPAIYVKRAQRDLELMREEKRAGKRAREVEIHSSSEEDGGEDANSKEARARVKVNKNLANRPIRYVVEDSTSESDDGHDARSVSLADSDHERDFEVATAQWAGIPSKRTPIAQGRSAGGKYWDSVISNILIRDKLERQQGRAGPQGRRPKKRSKVKSGGNAERSRTTHTRTQSASKSSTRRPVQQRLEGFHTPAVHLDDPDSLFHALTTRKPLPKVTRHHHNPFRRSLDAGTESARQGQPPRHQQKQAIAQQAVEHDWEGSASTFSRFSFDFAIERLPSGLAFRPQSYIGKGHLRELLAFESATTEPDTQTLSCSVYGIKLDNDISPEDFVALLPRLCDHVYEEYTSVPSSTVPSLASPATETLRFISKYMHIAGPSHRSRKKAAEAVANELEHLEARLDTFVASGEGDETAKITCILSFKWYMLEMAYRSHVLGVQTAEAHTFEAENSKDCLLNRLGELTQSLVHIGFHHTIRALKKAISAADGDDYIDDITCELWVCLIHLCTQAPEDDEAPPILRQHVLWELVESHLKHDASQRSLHPILAGEVFSFAGIALGALSQVSIHGMVTATVRLDGHWPLVLGIVERIKPSDFAKAYSTMSNTSRTRSSRYIWTIFARCLTLAERWNWKILDQSKLIGKLFDILNSRELQDLSIDGEASFPPFLSDFQPDTATSVSPDDTAFRIFLRILMKASKEAKSEGTKRASDLLSRLTMRTMPMRERLSYPRNPTPAQPRKHRSVLINHYSLFILLAAIDPASSERRFQRFKALLDFDEADFKARQECLKAACYLGVVYKQTGTDPKSLFGWMAEIAVELRMQYASLAKQRVVLQRALADKTNANHQPHQGRPVWKDAATHNNNKLAPSPSKQIDTTRVNREMSEVAVMMGILLASVQQVLEAKMDGQAGHTVFPDLAYLAPVWTVDLLNSPMALDPVVGFQLLRCLRSFLRIRREALPAPAAEPAAESQDEYGDFDFDYNDPALAAILGEEAVAADVQVNTAESEMKAMDMALAEIIRDHLSPAIYRLLSNINVVSLGQDTGVPDIPDRDTYISELVAAWSEMAAITVHHNLRDWSFYMSEYGKESWQRMTDVISRYLVGLHFAHGMIVCDRAAYKTYRDQVVEILLRSFAAPILPDGSGPLFSAILNIDMDSLLWRHLPISIDALTHKYDIGRDLLSSRLHAIFAAFCRNCKDIVTGVFHRPEDAGDSLSDIQELMASQRLNRQIVLHLVGSMVTAMRDQYDNMLAKTKSGGGEGGGGRGGIVLPHGGGVGRAAGTAAEYLQFCKTLVDAMKHEIGLAHVNERAVPQLRLIAGLIQ